MNKSMIVVIPDLRVAFRVSADGLLEVAPYNADIGKIRDRWEVKTGKELRMSDGDLMMIFHYLEIFNPIFRDYEKRPVAEEIL